MLQPYLDRMVSKLATDCMAQRAQRFFYKDWYAQNYNYCYDHIITSKAGGFCGGVL